MINKVAKNDSRKKRHHRIRRDVVGTAQKPRLVVFKSLKHIYAQMIDDLEGKTLASSNSLQKEIRDQIKEDMKKSNVAEIVGKAIAEKAKTAGIEYVVFDRAGYKYHGRVAALAEGARKAGLKF